MELKIFDSKTQQTKTEVRPTIKFNTRNGLIVFNEQAGELLKVATGDKISFAQDQSRKQDWYVFKDTKNGMTVRQQKDTANMAVSNKTVTMTLAQSIGLGGEQITLKSFISLDYKDADGLLVYPIITAHLKS